MKIAYLANHNNFRSDDTEGHLTRAMRQLGHFVIPVQENEFIPPADFVLYHKIFPKTKNKKVCWYFDKINFNNREGFVKDALKNSDLVFVTDETWARVNPSPNLHVLRQGIGDPVLGIPQKLEAEIVFAGSVYKDRFEMVEHLYASYGRRFQIYSNVHNRAFNNLCASVPIFVAPEYPADDYYWSNRVYLTLGSGGFLIHPRLKGLEAEYKDKEEIVFFDGLFDLTKKIDYYLTHPDEREKIRIAGWEKTRKEYTYKKRVEQLLQICTSAFTPPKK